MKMSGRMWVTGKDGKRYQVLIVNDKLRQVSARVELQRSPIVGGPIWIDKQLWHGLGSRGKLSKRLRSILPDDLVALQVEAGHTGRRRRYGKLTLIDFRLRNDPPTEGAKS